jgi:mycofactocin system glycosyltransferase
MTLAGGGADAVPAGFRLCPDHGLRVLAGGTVLAGGSPVRVLRLRPAGARAVAGWFAGQPVSGSRPARRLARRLLDAGMAHPVPPVGARPEDVTVVIPVKDRQAELARCLAGLRDLRVIVVDDASGDAAATAAVTAAAGVTLIRREVNGGPAAARNTGLAAVATPLVAFLDSDCVPEPGWLTHLLPHFTDPAIGAVAPRIVPHEAGRSWLARYEGASSTLDMGKRPSIVRPGARVSYVPGAALIVRKKSAGTGFDADMPVGEDVDFAWRLTNAGWRVRYEPVAVMGHEHRVRLRSWLARRRDYGTSAAALELRHPGAVRPLYVSGWTAATWLAVAAGRPGLAVTLTGTATALLARKLAPVAGAQAVPEAARLAGGGTAAAIRPIGSAITRTWLPVAVPAAIAFRKARLPLAVAVLTPPLLDWLDRRPPLDPVRYTAARLLDDVGYGAGVWQGCLRNRTFAPLRPAITGRGPRQPDIS